MPILPKQTLVYADGSRIHLDRIYTDLFDIKKDAKLRPANTQSFLQEEQRYNALFLRALSRMLARNGYDMNAERAFVNPKELPIQFSSQSHLILIDEQKIIQENEYSPRIGPNESTTRYYSVYGLIDKDFSVASGTVRCSLHAWDARAVRLLQNKGVSTEVLTSLGKDFLRLADMADHGYLHQLLLTQSSRLNIEFIRRNLGDYDAINQKRENKTTGDTLEDHALTMHAQILHHLFEESPARKAHLLTYAANAYIHLHEMQQTARANCHNEREKGEVDEAITYFAEIIAHRLFRCISPIDPDLTTLTAAGLSVQEAMSQVMLAPATSEQGLKALERRCSSVLHNTYRAIHEPAFGALDSFPLRVYSEDVVETTALGAVVGFNDARNGTLSKWMKRHDKNPNRDTAGVMTGSSSDQMEQGPSASHYK